MSNGPDSTFHLAEFAGYQPPAGRCRVEALPTTGGLRLRVAIFEPTAAQAGSLGTVCLLPGRAEFIEKYYETIGELLQRRFTVVAMDWRGQGGSDRPLRDRRKGHVDDFDDYVADLDALLTAIVVPRCPPPHLVLAHSMGATATLLAMDRGERRFERALLIAPMCALVGLPNGGNANRLAVLLNLLALGGAYVPGGGATALATKPFAGNRLTHDPARYRVMADMIAEHPWLGLGDPTIGWVHAAFAAMNRLDSPGFGERIVTPSLVLAAGADPLVSTPAIERLAARLRACRCIVLPGAKHEILFETDPVRAQFWAAFDAFLPGTPAVVAAAG